MKKIILVISLLILFLHAEAKLIVTSTTCNFQSGMALVERDIKIGWQMLSDKNGESQIAYQIQINENISGKNIYDSRKIISRESQMISVPKLNSNALGYMYKVRVWNDNNKRSEWSKPQMIRVMPSKIDASWIGAISRKNANIPDGRFPETDFKKTDFIKKWSCVDSLSFRSIVVRREFSVCRKKVIDAVVYVCGLGHYEMRINGAKIGDSEFAPLWSDYDKTAYYNVYDVTKYINSGSNAVGVLLGNGFFNVQRLRRYSKLMTSFGAPSLLLRLEINYSDGSQQVVKSASDGNWLYDFSPITFNSIYGGESYDARLEQRGC
jgi:alpha-L-rhamnosidase